MALLRGSIYGFTSSCAAALLDPTINPAPALCQPSPCAREGLGLLQGAMATSPPALRGFTAKAPPGWKRSWCGIMWPFRGFSSEVLSARHSCCLGLRPVRDWKELGSKGQLLVLGRA